MRPDEAANQGSALKKDSSCISNYRDAALQFSRGPIDTTAGCRLSTDLTLPKPPLMSEDRWNQPAASAVSTLKPIATYGVEPARNFSGRDMICHNAGKQAPGQSGCGCRVLSLDRKEAWTIMRLKRDDNEERGQRAIDLRLAARLRQIADTQHAPPYLRDRVFAGIAAEHFAEKRGRIRWDLIAAATGGAFLSAAAALAIWLAAPTAPPVPPQAESWVDIVLNQGTGAAVMETDQPASLKSWFASQVDYTVDVPDIPDANLRGGRLAYLGGIQGVAVEYEIAGQDLTYLMVPQGNVLDMLAEQGDTLVTWSSRGYQIVMWKQGGGTRALVGPLPRKEINDIADHCRRTMI